MILGVVFVILGVVFVLYHSPTGGPLLDYTLLVVNRENLVDATIDLVK